jgi:hypothetical protein
MVDPVPSNIASGSLDMALRDLLTHMMERKLDHVVLVMPGVPVHVTVTVASVQKTAEITKQVERIVHGR